MALGPGKYDALATYCMEQSQADAVMVIVVNGSKGTSGSGKVATNLIEYEIAIRRFHKKLPAVLRDMARTIEAAPPEAFLAGDG